MSVSDAVPVDPLPVKLFGARSVEPTSAFVGIYKAHGKEGLGKPLLIWHHDAHYREELMAGLEPGEVREIAFITAERIVWADSGDVLLCNSPPDQGLVAAAGEAGQTELDLHLSGVDDLDPLEEGKRVGTL